MRERDDADFEFAKIDSPRYRIVRAGRTDDRLARADRDRLAAGLASLDT